MSQLIRTVWFAWSVIIGHSTTGEAEAVWGSQLAGVVLPLLRAADVVGFSSGIQSCQRWHQSLAMFMMMTREALQPNVICYQALLRNLGKKRFVQEWWTLDVISDVWCVYIHIIYTYLFIHIYLQNILKYISIDSWLVCYSFAYLYIWYCYDTHGVGLSMF